jgi:sugar-specific transcriptional regulator TrmB
MENFKFILISIIIIAGMGLLGYWAVRTLPTGDVYVSEQKQQILEEKNRELAEEINKLKRDLEALQPKEEERPEVVTTTPTKPTTVTYKHQSLINDLQKLVTDKVFMKVGSQGTRVGTVQTFLNIYNNTSKRVDNDFGAGTKTDLIVFQKAEKITADGEAGPATFQKMIDWLKKQ